jgi:hypothetical protein
MDNMYYWVSCLLLAVEGSSDRVIFIEINQVFFSIAYATSVNTEIRTRRWLAQRFAEILSTLQFYHLNIN